MPYILATTLRKASECRSSRWEDLLLMPDDYSQSALDHPLTRKLMDTIDPLYGGPSYDIKYPEGIPTSISIIHKKLGMLKSGLIMFPLGHAKNTNSNLDSILDLKFRTLAAQGVANVADLEVRCTHLGSKSAAHVRQLHNFTITGVD